MLTGNAVYTYDLNSSDLAVATVQSDGAKIYVSRNFKYENRRPPSERLRGYCWRKAEKNFNGRPSASRYEFVYFCVHMTFLRESDTSLAPKNQKE